MPKLRNCGTVLAIGVICTLATGSLAQTFTTLVTLNGSNQGNGPFGSLIQGFNGELYGTTSGLQTGVTGPSSAGTVFTLTPAGQLTPLYSFCAKIDCPDGASPEGALVQHTNGNFYGTTNMGGSGYCNYEGGCGVVFQVTPQGVVTILYDFCAKVSCTDGAAPVAALVEGADGNLYGTTVRGGTGCGVGFPPGCGTVFEITTEGALTTLYSFCSKQTSCMDGSLPEGLIQATDGNFYGITTGGGAEESGTIFKITPSGKLTTVYSFCSQTNCADGANPSGKLIEDSNGDFYGTTAEGGLDTCDPPYGCGIVFKITMSGQLTVLHAFNGNDGFSPYAGVVQATDGNFYGTTGRGGNPGCLYDAGCGTLFSMTPAGNVRTLYRFCSEPNCTDGALPYAGLTQDTSGTFYGTTFAGGNQRCAGNTGCGTMFSLSVGLGPFVESLPPAGKVSARVGLFGTDLTGASAVMFNGTPADFSVRLPTLILARVPAGATTGRITVTLPGQTLSSNAPFYVIP